MRRNGKEVSGVATAKKRLDLRWNSIAPPCSGCEQLCQAKATQGVAPMSRDANEMHGAELRRQSKEQNGSGKASPCLARATDKQWALRIG
nr:MAG TPA: hypothetical protein [Caudoviricetes sp.]